MRVVIVGNGGVAMQAALTIKRKLLDATVIVVAPARRPGAASLAAGAMANVLAEVEVSFNGSNAATERATEIGLTARAMWRSFLHEHGREDVITASSTVVFLKKSSSPFEAANFQLMSDYVLGDRHGQFMTTQRLTEISPMIASNMQEAVEIEGEYAFDTRALFDLLDDVAATEGIVSLDDSGASIDLENDALVTTSGNRVRFDFLIVAAGSESASLTSSLFSQTMLQGVGSSYVIDPAAGLSGLSKHVVRTVNRGGAQCGIHTVPRVDGALYLGAGSYVAKPGPANHRIETLRYLFSTFEEEYVGNEVAYPLTARILLGYRPRSLDGFPLVGPFEAKGNVAMLSGMNRVGLTWAPYFAKMAAEWIAGNDGFSNVADWAPDRSPIPFGTDAQALEYFVESRLAAALEHRLISNSPSEVEGRRLEIRAAGTELQKLAKAEVRMPDGYSLAPDTWNALVDRFPVRCDR